MISQIRDSTELQVVRALIDGIVCGENEFCSRWLDHRGAKVLVEESSWHLDDEREQKYASAFSDEPGRSLYAVPLDSRLTETMTYRVSVTAQDIQDALELFFGFDVALINDQATAAVISTVDNFRMAAGSLGFVSEIMGDPVEASRNFALFLDTMAGSFLPRTLLNYMDWVDGADGTRL